MNWLESIFVTVLAGLTGQTGTLIVVLPLITAPIVALLRRSGTVAALTVGTGAICTVLALILLSASAGSPLDYALGGWRPPVGIGFHIDTFNALVAVMICGAFLLAAIHASVAKLEISLRASHLGAAGLLCLTGLLGVTLTGDLFNMFVFLEISSLSAYALIAAGGGRDRRALRAAFDYLIMGSIGASFFVIGVGFLYGVAGTLNMADMSARLVALGDNRAATAGLAFVIAGLGLKAAMFPVHQWLPSSYAYALPPVTVFLSASATKVALYALVRVLFDIAGQNTPVVYTALVWVIAPLSAIAALACSIKALIEPDIRRVLAWSSIAQAGYMMLAVSVGGVPALSAAIFHMIAHALMKSTLFMAVGSLVPANTQVFTSRHLRGSMRSAPMTMSLFAVAALSLAGMPPTLGFVSKWLLLDALISESWMAAAIMVAISGLVSFAYVAKILLPTVMDEPDPDTPAVRESAPTILILLTMLATVHIGLGVHSAPLRDLARAASQAVVPPTSIAVPVPEETIQP